MMRRNYYPEKIRSRPIGATMKQKAKELKNWKAIRHTVLLKNVWAGFADYIRAHPLLSTLTAAILAICYAGQAFSTQYYVDAEAIINNPESTYNWSTIGRFGLVWLKQLTGLDWFNPYLAGGLLLITLWLTALGTGYLFSYIDKRVNTAATGIFMLVYLIYPTYAEQFMFQFQAFEIVFGMFLLTVASWYFVQFLRENNPMAFVLSIVLLVFSFGIYQSMVNMQLCLYLGIFLFYLLANKEDDKVIRRSILFTIIHFLSAFLIYELIVKLFFSQSDYLSSQIAWQYEDFRVVVHDILGYVRAVFKGANAFYTISYKLCMLLLLILVIALIAKKKKHCIWYILGSIALALSPFYLSIITGIPTVPRAQLSLPLSCAILGIFCIHCLSVLFNGKWKRVIINAGSLLGALLLFVQAAPLMRLFYTQDVIGRSDLITATQMMDDIQEITNVFYGKPVVFIGHREALRNGSCYSFAEAPSYMCISAFELDYQIEPYFFYSSHRILGYFKTLGYPYAGPSHTMVEQAYAESPDMPCWPVEGSIRESDSYIIVKLSN